jgi:hypothetical protein
VVSVARTRLILGDADVASDPPVPLESPFATARYLSEGDRQRTTNTRHWRSLPNLEIQSLSRQHQSVGWNPSRSCNGTY